MPRRFLLIQTAFLGDVVLATALVEKLHACMPDTRIDFLVRKGNETALQGNPRIRRVLIWDKGQRRLANLWRLLGEVRRERYDVVVNVQRYASTGLLTCLSLARCRVGFDRNVFSTFFDRRIPHAAGEPGAQLHETERNQRLIAEFTDTTPAPPRLHPSEADFAAARTAGHDRAYICIAPASLWHTKQFPPEKWISLVRHALRRYHVHLIGARTDRSLCEEIREGAGDPTRVSNLAGALSVLESAALMAGAAMNFVNDSAPMHIASAMNAPVTAVFCSTIPGFGYGPLSDDRVVVETDRPLPCRPCGVHGRKRCPEGHFACAYTIDDGRLTGRLP